MGTDNDHFLPMTRCSELSINLLDDKPLNEALMECILQVLADVNYSDSAIRTALWCIYWLVPKEAHDPTSYNTRLFKYKHTLSYSHHYSHFTDEELGFGEIIFHFKVI